MGTVKKQVYDPHLLYHAINITVELEYKVPMQRIYDILVVVERNNEKLVDKITPNEVLELLKELTSSFVASSLLSFTIVSCCNSSSG